VALDDETSVVSFRRADVLDLVEKNPDAARAVMHELVCRGMEMCRRVEQLSIGQVEQRIARLVLRLAERAGTDRPGQGIWIPVPLTRQDLADLCGTTVETAIRVVSKMRRSGLMRATPSGILVMDRAGLTQVMTGKKSAAAEG
jgi:CRP/FNR family transcriptional regulator